MDEELVRYIMVYFSHLMTKNEYQAVQNTMYLFKTSKNAKMRQMIEEKGWIVYSEEVDELLKDGYKSFEMKTAQRILKERPDKVFLNLCPKCHKLARTPQAKQCRYCSYDWH
jgi:hypothetical protein